MRKRWVSSAAFVLIAALLGGLAAGCAEKFTPQRYGAIYIGQPEFEVEQTLGRPAHKFSDSWTYLHDEPFYKAIIHFRNGRVVRKVWYDPENIGGKSEGR